MSLNAGNNDKLERKGYILEQITPSEKEGGTPGVSVMPSRKASLRLLITMGSSAQFSL